MLSVSSTLIPGRTAAVGDCPEPRTAHAGAPSVNSIPNTS